MSPFVILIAGTHETAVEVTAFLRVGGELLRRRLFMHDAFVESSVGFVLTAFSVTHIRVAVISHEHSSSACAAYSAARSIAVSHSARS